MLIQSFKEAKENGRVICIECHAHDDSIRFYSSTGIDIHYKRAHKQSAFIIWKIQLSSSVNDISLFIDQISAFRSENSSGLALFKEYEVRAEHLETYIQAMCKQEAVKMR